MIKQPPNTTAWSVYSVTYFDPMWSSSGWYLQHVTRSMYIALWKWHVTSCSMITVQYFLNTVHFRNKIRWYKWTVKSFWKWQMSVMAVGSFDFVWYQIQCRVLWRLFMCGDVSWWQGLRSLGRCVRACVRVSCAHRGLRCLLFITKHRIFWVSTA